MRRPPPFILPACAAVALCAALCGALHVYGSPRVAPPPLVETLVDGILRLPVNTPEQRRAGDDVVGRTMPPLAFDRWPNTDGNRPPETAGKVTLYRWWTDGCPHCEKTLPAVEALRQKYGPDGLQVVAVYHPKPPRPVRDGDVAAAAEALGYRGPVAIDLDWSELKKFYLDTGDRPATSASFLVDRDGVIRFVHPGPRFYPSADPGEATEDADYRRVEAAVRRLLGGRR